MSNSMKQNIMKGLKVAGIFVFAILLLAILITAKVSRGEVVCTEIEVKILKGDEVHFINEKDVLAYINNYGQSVVINQAMKDIDKSEIEARIERNPYVAKAEVFTNFEGKIKVKVEQKNPIYRVFNNKGVSYYVDQFGENIPISSKFTPRLVVAAGYLPDNSSAEGKSKNQEINSLVNFIKDDEFWDAMIGQFYLAENGDFILYPKIGEHKVNLGSAENLEEKFKYLNIFYKEAIKKVDWKKYHTINLKYKGQIICTKNN